MSSGTTYRLVRPAAPAQAPVLDDDQQRVVDHQGGPLLVLAGPGTGKTTTLVEAIVDRIETPRRRPVAGAGADLLAQGRRAAARPGHRAAGPHDRLGDLLDHPLLRLRADPEVRPPRALPRPAAPALRARAGRRRPRAAAAHARVGRLAAGARPGAGDPRLRARGPDGAVEGSREGPGGRRARRPRRAGAGAGVRRRRPVPPQLPRQPRRPVGHRLRRPDPPRGHRGDRPPGRAATAVPARVRRRVPGHRPRPGRPAPRPRRRRWRPRRGGRPAPVDLRVPGC